MRAYLLLAALLVGFGSVAEATNADCTFLLGGKEVLAGPCEASNRAPTKAFSIASPDGMIAARVVTKGGGVGEAYWNGGAKGQKADTLIGTVVLVGACWASDKTKLCMTR
jgi:hypothetical protein